MTSSAVCGGSEHYKNKLRWMRILPHVTHRINPLHLSPHSSTTQIEKALNTYIYIYIHTFIHIYFYTY